MMVASYYIFLNFGLKLKKNESVLITLIFGLSIAGLRISTELFRNELGLIFCFGALTFLENIHWGQTNRKNIIGVVLLLVFALLVFVSHELVSLFFVLYLSAKICSFLVSRSKFYLEVVVLLALGLFITLPWFAFSENLTVWGVHIFKFYGVKNIADSLPNAITPEIVFSLFSYIYYPLVLFVIFGLIGRRQTTLAIISYWLLIIAFSPVIYSGYGYYIWDRWAYFLIIPFSYFAYYGIERLSQIGSRSAVVSKELMVILLYLIVFWKPIAYINSGGLGTIKSTNQDEKISSYVPPVMAGNPFHEFNKPENNNFFTLLNKMNPDGRTIVIDHSINQLARYNKLSGKKILGYYNQLTPDIYQSLIQRKEGFYTIGSDFGIKNSTRSFNIGTIRVYQFDTTK